MRHPWPTIEFVDTTLREGFQSAVEILRPGVSPADYGLAVLKSLETSHLEIYGPDVYYPAQDYQELVEIAGTHLQLYCGVLDRFDPDRKHHIGQLHSPRLSLTVIHKNAASLDGLRRILDLYPSATLRVGLECAGSAHSSLLPGFVSDLADLERIETITLSDSNGVLAPPDLRALLGDLPLPLPQVLGFHLHNDRGLAVANALAAIDAAAEAGQQRISFDYSFGGLGERYGILSLQELSACGQDIVKAGAHSQMPYLSSLFSDAACHFHRLPHMKDVVHVAASHFDANGELRAEYRSSADVWSRSDR